MYPPVIINVVPLTTHPCFCFLTGFKGLVLLLSCQNWSEIETNSIKISMAFNSEVTTHVHPRRNYYNTENGKSNVAVLKVLRHALSVGGPHTFLTRQRTCQILPAPELCQPLHKAPCGPIVWWSSQLQILQQCGMEETRAMKRVYLSSPNVTCNDGSPAG